MMKISLTQNSLDFYSRYISCCWANAQKSMISDEETEGHMVASKGSDVLWDECVLYTGDEYVAEKDPPPEAVLKMDQGQTELEA